MWIVLTVLLCLRAFLLQIFFNTFTSPQIYGVALCVKVFFSLPCARQPSRLSVSSWEPSVWLPAEVWSCYTTFKVLLLTRYKQSSLNNEGNTKKTMKLIVICDWDAVILCLTLLAAAASLYPLNEPLWTMLHSVFSRHRGSSQVFLLNVKSLSRLLFDKEIPRSGFPHHPAGLPNMKLAIGRLKHVLQVPCKLLEHQSLNLSIFISFIWPLYVQAVSQIAKISFTV